MHAFVVEDDRYGPTRLLQWNLTDRETILMVFQVSGPEGPYTDRLDSVSHVESYDVTPLSSRSDQFSMLVEDEITAFTRDVFHPYAEENVVVVPPVVFRTDRSVDVQLVGEHAALERLLDRLPDGLDVEIRQLSAGGVGRLAPAEHLTGRQRRVLSSALAAGYYDEPRRATLEEVAADLDIAPGTVAEHVRKAEARLVQFALGHESE